MTVSAPALTFYLESKKLFLFSDRFIVTDRRHDVHCVHAVQEIVRVVDIARRNLAISLDLQEILAHCLHIDVFHTAVVVLLRKFFQFLA